MLKNGIWSFKIRFYFGIPKLRNT